MGCSSSMPSHPTHPYGCDPGPVRGAGCLFQSETHVLAGFRQGRRSTSTIRICGLGGKAAEEPWWQTAFRETIEDLFAPPTIPFNVYYALARVMIPKVRYDAETAYATLEFHLEDLTTFLNVCAQHITTPLYTTFPTTWQDLILGRVGSSEITDLVLWPRKNIHREFRVTRDFLRDFAT